MSLFGKQKQKGQTGQRHVNRRARGFSWCDFLAAKSTALEAAPEIQPVANFQVPPPEKFSFKPEDWPKWIQ